MLINYEVNPNNDCLTECPNNMKPKVGSLGCRSCVYFIYARTIKSGILICSFNLNKK